MCTAFSLETKQGFVSARTMESPTPGSYEHFVTLSLPRGFCVSNAQNMAIKNKYAMVGSSHYGLYALCDGVNETGLSGSVNLFPHLACYPQTPQKELSFAPQDLLPYLLGNAKDCKEAKAIAENVEMVAIAFEDTGKVLPLHIALFDSKGGFLVIEPTATGLQIYESPIRVMTNAPDFPWHIKNLANYAHLKTNNQKDSIFKDIFPFGQGSGSMGLPGDFTPASRFVRASFFLSASPVFESSEEGIRQALRILHQFDIPFGSVSEKIGEEEALEITQYSAMMDNVARKYYLNYYREFDVICFDLEDFLELEEPKILKTMS
ncbi:linear amide C-N hydrolase [Helicobacter sp. 11S02596-1]|uniref:linear amide C-N hydrolase n=1 Tax=Helicobacter sp. 11S02596-1 TaxID=1476194 RepID=UPI000BA61B47|nr:linear amide C-N hydrolase [Helicobacter sp. 11S02596-1]PAF45218.1 hypothetical protein BJI48_01270 [Helicobacter sp. 11S02596-1]